MKDKGGYTGAEVSSMHGKNNYSQFAADMDLPEIMKDLILWLQYPMESAIWFFQKQIVGHL